MRKLNQTKPFYDSILVVISFFTYIIYQWSHTESTDNAYIESDISTISAEVNGNIIEVVAPDNTEVKAGDIIARIDSTYYETLVNSALAKIKAGEYGVES
ncbi:MAG UNVERIFIED_CONTAM: biotin/lipoyl-binding protein [Rickettsiaceae bacterium]